MPDSGGASAKINAFFKQHKVAAYGSVIIIGAGAVILYRRHAAAQASSAQTTTPDTTSGNTGIDPQTGFPIGSAEDEQALQQQQASGGYSTGFGYDPFAGGYNPFLGSGGAGSGGGSTGGGTGKHTGITSNDQWLIQAEKVLPNGHSASVETALSRVLGGLTVTWSQRALFLEAKGVLGNPPGGYPTPIKLSNGGGDHGGSHQKVHVPDVVGEAHGLAVASMKAAGLKVQVEGPGKIVQQNPAAGSEVRRGSTVVLFGAFK